MKKSITAAFALLLGLTLVLGCGKKSAQEENASGTQGAQASGDLSKAAVTVNGAEITEVEISREVNNLKKQMAGRAAPEQIASMAGIIRKQAVKNLVSRTLLGQAAAREKLTATDEEVEVKIAEIMKNFTNVEDFNNQLKAGGFTNEEFRAEVKNSVVLEKLIGKLTATLEKTDETAAKKYYDENNDRFMSPEKVRASHILIKVEQSDSDSLKTAKKTKLEGVVARLRSGEDFSKLATENSDCPSKDSGGDLGYFVRGQMVQPFEDEAFALKVGELSGIVETKFGYHVIKLTDRQAESTTPFAQVKDDITSYLDNMRKQEEVESYLDAMRGMATIEYADSSDAQ